MNLTHTPRNVEGKTCKQGYVLMAQKMKPWSSFSNQLKLLEDRGMVIDDIKAALNYLERIGYYRLSGYRFPFREGDLKESFNLRKAIRKDTFIKKSRFEDVVKLYIFDKKLRLHALDALERIEMALRVDIAHLLGKKDPLAHKKPECLHGNFTKKKITRGPDEGKTAYEIWLEKFKTQLNRSRKEDFVRHHHTEYGDLPIWAAIEVWNFGLLSKLYAGMQYKDQQIIAHKYGATDGKKLGQWLRSLNYIRNVSAHHSRLWNVNIVERSSIPDGWSANLNNERPFFYFCLMQNLLNVICPNSNWGVRFQKLLEIDFPTIKNKSVSVRDLGVIDGWKEWDLWA